MNISNAVTVSPGDGDLNEQAIAVSEALGKAVAEAVELAGPDQELLSVELEFDDGIRYNIGGHLMQRTGLLTVTTRLR